MLLFQLALLRLRQLVKSRQAFIINYELDIYAVLDVESFGDSAFFWLGEFDGKANSG
jgi:hypothetical protein